MAMSVVHISHSVVSVSVENTVHYTHVCFSNVSASSVEGKRPGWQSRSKCVCVCARERETGTHIQREAVKLSGQVIARILSCCSH